MASSAPALLDQHGSQCRAVMGGPLCSLVRGALAKVSEGPVGPWRSSTDNDEDIRSLPNPSDPVPLPESGRGGGRGEQILEIWAYAPRSDLNQVVTAPSQPQDRSYHRDPTTSRMDILTSLAEALNLGTEEKTSTACCVVGLEGMGGGGSRALLLSLVYGSPISALIPHSPFQPGLPNPSPKCVT